MKRKVTLNTSEVTYQCSCGRCIHIQIRQNIFLSEADSTQLPEHKLTPKQLRDQQIKQLGEQFVRNSNERMLTKALKKHGITREEYERMKEWLDKNKE